MKKYGLPLLLVAIVGVMIAIFAIGNNAPAKPAAALLGEKHTDLGQKHISDGEAHTAYNSEMPSSGPHYTSPAPWGAKTAEIADEILIHNAEHGGIVITYQPTLPSDQIDKLKALAASLPKSSQFNEVKIVLAPRAKNTSPIEIMAWTYTLNLKAFDEAKIQQFYNDHLDKGPELVP